MKKSKNAIKRKPREESAAVGKLKRAAGVQTSQKGSLAPRPNFDFIERHEYKPVLTATKITRVNWESMSLYDHLKRFSQNVTGDADFRLYAVHVLGYLCSGKRKYSDGLYRYEFNLSKETYPIVKDIAVQASTAALRDPWWKVQQSAFHNLAVVGDPRSQQIFTSVLRGKADWIFQNLSENFIGAPLLRHSGEYTAADRRVESLSGIRRPTKAQYLAYLQIDALDGLAKIGGKGNISRLLGIMNGENKWLYRYARHALAEHSDPELMRLLIKTVDFQKMTEDDARILIKTSKKIMNPTQPHWPTPAESAFSPLPPESDPHNLDKRNLLPETKVAVLSAANALGTLPAQFDWPKIYDFANSSSEFKLAKHYGLVK
ncbi:MAG: hypothetical protein HY544_04780 [Candidatus Diapherotrites archaeon]|uniref:HEAT repeat domain-containing protein n=1 Tax=Candidatus Iainarchaeum sp. TaxID=3101447 RepID=A0A8T3YKN5_9ARCH|nr:hypothetical protein [Candidatus Diapherotrites archaeon]